MGQALLRLVARTTILTLVLVSAVISTLASVPTRNVACVDGRLLTQAEDISSNENDEVPVVVVGSSGLSLPEIQQLNRIGKVSTVIGNIATVRLVRARIYRLGNLGFVTRVESGYGAPALDVSVPEIWGVDIGKKTAERREAPLNGTGVIVGIVDTGIDLKHPDFRFENGSSKILYLWDQTTTGVQPAGYRYGTEWTREQIEAGACDSKDQIGHGTHVAGIASATGGLTGRYVGVAPGSLLIVVKSGFNTRKGWRFRWAEVIDGVNYIWEKAKFLGKRAAVNLSIGSNAGGHDGSSPVERALDHLVSEGLVVVVSAGNEGDKKTHAEGKLKEGESASLSVQPESDEDEIYLEVWYSTSNAFDLSIRSPSGLVINGSTPKEGVSMESGTVHVSHDIEASGKAWKLSVGSSMNLTGEAWMITIQGRSVSDEGGWNAWLGSKGQFLLGSGYEITRDKTVNVPGTGRNVITVGAYVTRMRWTTMNGTEDNYTSGENIGDIASFSSWGPTRDGRLKPEIAAPGKGIISSRSADSLRSARDPDDAYSIKQGTSMAAPHITGVVALILQCNPHASSSSVREILRIAARQDSHTGQINMNGSYIWGFGKPDAKRAVTICASRYPIKFFLVGIPSSISTNVVIDGIPRVLASGGVAATLELSVGSQLMISVEHVVIGESSRFMLLFKRTSEYVFDRWIVEPQEYRPTVPPKESISVVVERPMTIVAEWKEQIRTEFDQLTIAAIWTAMCLFIMLALIIAVQRKRRPRIGQPSDNRDTA